MSPETHEVLMSELNIDCESMSSRHSEQDKGTIYLSLE